MSLPPHATGASESGQRSLHGTNPARAGERNERLVLEAILRAGESTRLQLAEQTGLSPAAIANITQRLTDRGFVFEKGRRTGVRGMPAIRFAVNPDGCFSYGVNIDRDHVTLVALDLTGAVRARYTQEIDFAAPRAVTAFIGDALATLRGERLIDGDRVLGMGVALPGGLGHVDLPGLPRAYAEWDSVDLPALLAPLGTWPVITENDAAAAAIGEARFGSGLTHRSFFYVLLSAGLGGGLVVAGSYHHGATGRAGRIGFLSDRAGAPLQSIVSLSALKADLAAHGIAPIAPAELASAEADATAVINGWIERAAAALARPVATISCLIDPGAIVIGGRLPVPLIDRLTAAIERHRDAVDDPVVPAAPVLTAQLAADAPAIGAAILPFNDLVFLSAAD
ncbi:ROK family transcriptional regulator [Sphingomonas sp. BK580]|uniref:ROK family transcriptional regulator n=1 Tax=Sphingomonas sp. BK580 TaxID=2586972 RepID=UPI00160D253E|nr:ROK family transcriptional regulator [Sphingomonas sp. BK580]MBB3691957.1 putative NBD/HSP70 family sugar kinase [Sphingomonas sp. BK580]